VVAYAQQALAKPQLRATQEDVAAQTGKRPIEAAICDYLQKK
jgi:hypothetical protein